MDYLVMGKFLFDKDLQPEGLKDILDEKFERD
jgi:hypothetical protein